MKHEVTWLTRGFLPCFIGVSPSPKAFAKAMEYLSIKNPPPYLGEGLTGDAATHWFGSDDKQIIIMSFDLPTTKKNKVKLTEVIGIVAHEATHAADYVFDVMAEKNPSCEFKAYLTQMLVQDTVAILVPAIRKLRA